MGRQLFEYVGNLDTLLAVCVGAVLATGGALVADVIQERAGRKRRERDAARFFGEILTSIDRILDVAFASQEIGERWGSVTRRLYRTAQNEAGVYERNRERLFDIRDMGLRSRIHEHFLSKSVCVTAVLEYCNEVMEIEKRLGHDSSMSSQHDDALKAQLAEQNESREAALVTLVEERAKTKSITADLQRIARVEFSEIEARAS